jgi:plastocyanin
MSVSGHLRFALGALALSLSFLTPVNVGAAEPANTIVVRNFMFTPTSLTVKAGARVTWTNKDEEPHTVASSEGVFRSAALDTGDSFSYQFDKPGTYHYTCTIHPRMVGTITVQ